MFVSYFQVNSLRKSLDNHIYSRLCYLHKLRVDATTTSQQNTLSSNQQSPSPSSSSLLTTSNADSEKIQTMVERERQRDFDLRRMIALNEEILKEYDVWVEGVLCVYEGVLCVCVCMYFCFYILLYIDVFLAYIYVYVYTFIYIRADVFYCNIYIFWFTVQSFALSNRILP
jgi:hypothetical protein